MSFEGTTSSSNKVFYQVYDQKLRTRVPEGTEGAISRKLTKGKNEGKEVWERETQALYGLIEDISIEETEFEGGKVKQLRITLDKNEEGKNPVLTVGIESKNGRDLMKILPAVDFKNEVRLMPYRFTPEGSVDEISGFSVAQKDAEGKFTIKVQNFFFDPEKKEYINGFPTIDWDNASESDKKIYKIQRDEFLVKYLTEKVLPNFAANPNEEVEYPDNPFSEEEMPF